mgnify:CR=1 FL=1
MKDDNLYQLLKTAENDEIQPQFDSTGQFKTRFFDAVRKAENERKSSKAAWWLGGAVTAAALFAIGFFPWNMPVAQNNGNSPETCSLSKTRRLNDELSLLFPENYINLWLVNGNLQTADAQEPGSRNILVNHVLECLDNGRKQFLQMSLISSNNNKSELHSKQVNGSVWVYSPDGKMVAVDTDLALQLDDGSSLRIQKSNLLAINGQAVPDIFIHNGKRYQWSQIVRRI